MKGFNVGIGLLIIVVWILFVSSLNIPDGYKIFLNLMSPVFFFSWVIYVIRS